MDATTFNVFQSNRLEALALILSEQLKRPNPNQPFKPETILVHSPGMSEWLKISIAEKLGIAANIDFPLPSSFIWRLYQTLIQDVPDTSVYNKDRLRWHIRTILPELISDPAFASIQTYLSPTSDKVQARVSDAYRDLRQFNLSEKIADAYDNYLMYRPEWLAYWDAGYDDLPGNDEIGHQQWQAILWRRLGQRLESLGINTHNRHTLHNTLLDILSKPLSEAHQAALPSRLFVFGVSSLPTHQLDVLQALSKHIEVDVLWFNPSSVYWGDIISDKTKARIAQSRLTQMENGEASYFVSGNPLLASWGKVGRDYLDNLANRNSEFNDFFIPPTSSTLLEAIKHDIYQLEYRESAVPLSVRELNSDVGKRPFPYDDSIKIHSCHSRYRELEVLHDTLLSWFDRDETLAPKDIVVMVPDINDYAPYIDAIFGNKTQASNVFLPYAISDRSGVAENPTLAAYLSLIGITTTRFKVSEVLDWLEVPTIMAGFDIDLAELALIKKWVIDANIKWSLDGQEKANWALPTDDLNTWLFGLKRMLLGFSVGNEAMWNGIPSFDSIEGLQANTLAKLIAYVSYLNELKSRFSKSLTIEQWFVELNKLVDDMFSEAEFDDTQIQYQLKQLHDANEQLLSYHSQGDVSGAVSAIVIKQIMNQLLSTTGVSQRFLAGKINFCTLMPMRSVPFKMVCILGLNDGEFPRHVEPLSFDLVNQNSPRKGDRSRKLDERYLFLEALCSAQQKLHLSYIGLSDRNNKPMAPSLLVSELEDYITDSFVSSDYSDKKMIKNSGEELIVDNCERAVSTITVKDHLKIQHHLQPFNTQYFVDNQCGLGANSYNKQWFDVSSELLENDTEGVSEPSTDDGIEPVAQTASQTSSDALINNSMRQFDVQLDALLMVAKNPIKYFYRQILGINLDIDSETIDDNEPFETDGLQRYQYVDKLFSLRESDARQRLSVKALAEGSFPSGQWGVDMLSDYKNRADTLVSIESTIMELASAAMANYKLNLKGEQRYQVSIPAEIQHTEPHCSMSLQGQFETKNGVLLVPRFHDIIRYDDEVAAWLSHLVRCIAKKPGPSIVICLKSANQRGFAPLSASQAQEFLAPWLSLFVDVAVEQQYVPWFGRLAKVYIESLLSSESRETALSAAQAGLASMLDPMSFNTVDAYLEKAKEVSYQQGTSLVNKSFEERTVALLEGLYSQCKILKNNADLEAFIDESFAIIKSLKDES